MIGITSCGYHIPFCRLEREKIGQAWARRAGKGERAAIYFDEDSLTLGLEAALRCVEQKGKAGIDAFYFSSTSAPFWQRSSASFMAAACDLPLECETMDCWKHSLGYLGASSWSGCAQQWETLTGLSCGW